jgi:hypothetical protein
VAGSSGKVAEQFAVVDLLGEEAFVANGLQIVWPMGGCRIISVRRLARGPAR